MNMTVLFKKYTYGLLLIATTLIGFACNFTNAVNLPTPNDYYGFNDYTLTPGITYDTTNELGNNHMKIFCFSQLNNGDIIDFNNDDGTFIPYQFYINEGAGIFHCSYSRLPIYSIKITSNKNNFYFDYFDITDNIGNSACPNCPTCPGINGQCSISDKVSENIIFSGSKSFTTSYSNMFNYGTEGAGTYCMKFTSSNPQTLTMGFANGATTTPTNLYTLYNDQYGNTICLYGNKPYLNVKLNASSNTINYEIYKLTDLLSDDIPCTQQNCQTCEEQYTSTECQEEYNLIPIEDIDQTYCINNNLCPIIEGTGDVQWSALYINNVQHLGNDIINIDIPEEIERDYNYDSGETNIDVIGYGYDQAKMQSMVNTQFTPPTSEDLENVIGKIADFLPLLAIMLLIVYAWRLIKKVF